jgi:hypothetical protein
MNALDDQIHRLEAASVPSTASRPDTSATVNERREDVTRNLVQSGLENSSAGEVVETIWDLDPVWVMGLLQQQRSPDAPSDIGCWVPRQVQAHPTGYTKINLRNTRRPGSDSKIGCSPFLHQLAIVAKGEGASLLNTGPYQPYEVCKLNPAADCAGFSSVSSAKVL